jgi:glycosyltransferase involved in cell wall biosynthesis
LIANGWEATKIDVLPHFQKLPEKVTPPNADAPILYFGRLSAEKGVADLVRAMEHTRDIPLLIAGDGPERPALQSLAQELKLTNVEFVGHQNANDLDKLICACRFSVLPSRAYETLGKTILESYARERAVIASDLGSRRELVQEGETGLLFRPGDVGELASAIRFLADRPELSATMGLNGREFVRGRHSPESHYVALNRLYEDLAGRSQKSVKPKVIGNLSLPVRVGFIGGRGVISKYSGVETYYEEVGKRLAAVGDDVTVYCRNYFTPAIARHNKMRLVRLPTIRSKHLETLIHTFLSTLHACFSRYDVVHYHCLGPALFSFLPRLFGKKTVVTVQGLDWKRKKWGRVASAVLRWGEKASARFPDATVVVSQELQQHYRLIHGVETAYIPNGAMLRTRTAGVRLQKWGLQPDKYILFLGRFSPEKNCHLLVEAFKRIETDVKLVLAGGSSHSDDYMAAIHRHESDKIRFADWVAGDALDDLLTNAMLFVLPSDLEGLSLALLEAMGAGICTLASEIPENCELIGDTGFTFVPGDVNDLERMLRLLIEAPQIRENTGLHARERVRGLYQWDSITSEIRRIYLQLMNASPDPANAFVEPAVAEPRSGTDVAA